LTSVGGTNVVENKKDMLLPEKNAGVVKAL
jgi:hypothetical protein